MCMVVAIALNCNSKRLIFRLPSWTSECCAIAVIVIDVVKSFGIVFA